MAANCYNWLTSNMFRPYSAIIRLTTDGVKVHTLVIPMGSHGIPSV